METDNLIGSGGAVGGTRRRSSDVDNRRAVSTPRGDDVDVDSSTDEELLDLSAVPTPPIITFSRFQG